MKVIVEFSGGLEQLFGGKKRMRVDVVEGEDMRWLMEYLIPKMTDSRVDLFLQDGMVRPGILVLINDADWEIVGEEDYMLMENDVIHFASTLHGG